LGGLNPPPPPPGPIIRLKWERNEVKKRLYLQTITNFLIFLASFYDR
jgi:hypothetical protein